LSTGCTTGTKPFITVIFPLTTQHHTNTRSPVCVSYRTQHTPIFMLVLSEKKANAKFLEVGASGGKLQFFT